MIPGPVTTGLFKHVQSAPILPRHLGSSKILSLQKGCIFQRILIGNRGYLCVQGKIMTCWSFWGENCVGSMVYIGEFYCNSAMWLVIFWQAQNVRCFFHQEFHGFLVELFMFACTDNDLVSLVLLLQSAEVIFAEIYW